MQYLTTLIIELYHYSLSAEEKYDVQTMNYLSHQMEDDRFQNHWNTFITEWGIANIGEYIQHQLSHF